MINTSSTSGLFGNIGQTNYGAAKTGIATFSIIANAELGRYGVRVNAIAPVAATRLTNSVNPTGRSRRPESGPPMDPANVAPFVAYLATEDCPINGRVFFVVGGKVHLFQPFAMVDHIEKDGTWTVEELQQAGAPRRRTSSSTSTTRSRCSSREVSGPVQRKGWMGRWRVMADPAGPRSIWARLRRRWNRTTSSSS